MDNYVCPIEKANHLDGRFRKWLQNPKRILGRYVKEGMIVLVPDQINFYKEVISALKPDGKLLIVEPKYIHVSKRDFEQTLHNAMNTGFKPVERPRVFMGRAIVFSVSQTEHAS